MSKPQKVHITLQLDGIGDDSDIDDDDEDDIGEVSIHGDEDEDDADDDKAGNDNSEYEGKEDPDPLNSDDDLTEPGTPDSNADLFDTDNVIVCQYDKVIGRFDQNNTSFVRSSLFIYSILILKKKCRLQELRTDGSST